MVAFKKGEGQNLMSVTCSTCVSRILKQIKIGVCLQNVTLHALQSDCLL
jgi:hypothetical protein